MSPDPPYKTLIVGHSYVHWLRVFLETPGHGSGFADLVVDGHRCDVEFLGVRGATVDTFLAPDMFARILAAHPDCVFLCLGGNSVDRPSTSPAMVALDIIRLAKRLLESGVTCVCVGQVCRRLKWRTCNFSVGASRVQELNTYLTAFSSDTDGVFFWRHKRLWTSVHPVFRRDGIHYSDIGNYRFFRSLRGAIMAAIRRILPSL